MKKLQKKKHCQGSIISKLVMFRCVLLILINVNTCVADVIRMNEEQSGYLKTIFKITARLFISSKKFHLYHITLWMSFVCERAMITWKEFGEGGLWWRKLSSTNRRFCFAFSDWSIDSELWAGLRRRSECPRRRWMHTGQTCTFLNLWCKLPLGFWPRSVGCSHLVLTDSLSDQLSNKHWLWIDQRDFVRGEAALRRVEVV